MATGRLGHADLTAATNTPYIQYRQQLPAIVTLSV